MYPAFQAYLSATTSISEGTTVKVQFDVEDFDTDNCYDSTTNYEFKPTVAGKYFVYVKMMFDTAATNMKNQIGRIYKNDVLYTYFNTNFDASYGEGGAVVGNAIIDLNGSTDYIHASVFVDTANNADLSLLGGTREAIFGAYRIGA
jgi:hypothetical protein